MGHAILHNGRADLAVMLSTGQVHGDLFESHYALPVPSHAFST